MYELSQEDVDAFTLFIKHSHLSTLSVRWHSSILVDHARLLQVLRTCESLKVVSIAPSFLSVGDLRVLTDMIKHSHTIHSFSLDSGIQHLENVYSLLDAVQVNTSIVSFRISDRSMRVFTLDLERIKRVLVNNHVLASFQLLFREIVNDVFDIRVMVQGFEAFDRVCITPVDVVNQTGDGHVILKVLRVFAGRVRDVLPREVLDEILYCLDSLWSKNKFRVIRDALSDKRTLGYVHCETVGLSKAYLFVRCRDALKKIR